MSSTSFSITESWGNWTHTIPNAQWFRALRERPACCYQTLQESLMFIEFTMYMPRGRTGKSQIPLMCQITFAPCSRKFLPCISSLDVHVAIS